MSKWIFTIYTIWISDFYKGCHEALCYLSLLWSYDASSVHGNGVDVLLRSKFPLLQYTGFVFVFGCELPMWSLKKFYYSNRWYWQMRRPFFESMQEKWQSLSVFGSELSLWHKCYVFVSKLAEMSGTYSTYLCQHTSTK